MRALARHFPALVLTGARQTGKTTLLRELFPTHAYVSLDLPADAHLAEEDPGAFLARYPPPLLVDEIQYAPGLFRHLKADIDRHRGARGRFILTGSQKFTLMKEVSDSLAGRVGLVELETLSVAELGPDLARVLDRGVGALLARGFFPSLWADPELPRVDFYRSYLATYLERDVRQILNVASLRDFDRFMRVAATRTGQLLNKSDMARDVGIAPKTVNDWLSVLEASNQIALLEPYHENPGKRVVKSPKLYFTDPGLAAFLLGLTEETLAGSAHLGALWETFVYAELRKELARDKGEATLWFYRDPQIEIDFLLAFGGGLQLADAKARALPARRDFQTLEKVRSLFSRASQRLTIFAPAEHSFPLDADHLVVSGFECRAFLSSL